MRLKDLFTVPTGQKVTEKHLRRVLISSICSILLCMTCLVSTTWAWFAVSIKNTGNNIQVAQWSLAVSITPTPALAETEEETSPVQYENGVYTLREGVYSIDIQFVSNAQGNDLDQANVYLIMVENIDQTETKYSTVFTLDENGGYIPIQKTYQVGEGKEAELSFSFTRMNPQIDNDLVTAVFKVEEEETTQATTDSTGSGENTDPTQSLTGDETDPAAGSSDDVTSTTKPSTEPSTEATTAPTTEPAADTTIAPTEESSPEETTTTQPETNPTESGATEGTDPSTETTTASTESTAESTGE